MRRVARGGPPVIMGSANGEDCGLPCDLGGDEVTTPGDASVPASAEPPRASASRVDGPLLDRILGRYMPAPGAYARRQALSSVRERLFGVKPAPLTFARYVVLHRLGAGTSATVYAAYDPELDRRVAVKVFEFEPGTVSAAVRSTLVSEAKLMAKLLHPNVVPVHDVGHDESCVFIVTALVAGTTLRGWLEEAPRSWAAVTKAFLQAGRGLAAAHEASIVHRDFKPENVLVGTEGRVLVTDFGLAEPSATRQAPLALAQASASGPTRRPARAGTPAYMAPELWAGAPASPATDQYAFFVAFREALALGDPDEPGAVPARAGQMRRFFTGRSRVPRWLRRIVERGAAELPGQRWPSLGAALDQIERTFLRRRFRVVGLAAAGAVLLAGTTWLQLWAHAHDARMLCSGGAERVEAVWNDTTAQGLARAFEQTGLPYAGAAWTSTQERLDRYLGTWHRAYVDVCEATTVRREQSEARMELRLTCLDDQLVLASTLVRRLAAVDEAGVKGAASAIAALPDPESCTRTAFDGRLRFAGTEATGASAGLRSALGSVQLSYELGQYEEGAAAARKILETTDPTFDRPVRAEATYWLGEHEHRLNRDSSAFEFLSAAALEAEAVGLDVLAARAHARAVRVLGHQLGRVPEAMAWSRHAEAAVARVGREHEVASELDDALCLVFERAGRESEALSHCQRALERRVRVHGTEHAAVVSSRINLASVLMRLGRLDEATREVEEALRAGHAVYGEVHPRLTPISTTFANLALRKGDFEALEKYAAEAVENERRTTTVRRVRYATLLYNLAAARTLREDYEGAVRSLDEALGVLDRIDDDGGHLRAMLLTGRASALGMQHRYDEAVLFAREAVTDREKAGDLESLAYFGAVGQLGAALLDRAQPRDAEPLLRRALQGYEAADIKDHAAWIRYELGRLLAGRPAMRTTGIAMVRAAATDLERFGPRLAPISNRAQAWLRDVDAGKYRFRD